ncbi:MAG TPA: FHA domain-containing protein [Gemmataceae bacterium]|nr:FHA domain-containing protein [Gemmataceae bacterium]
MTNMRSGESHPVDPERTLIGYAAHADIPLPDDAAYLAALVAQYPSGWVVHSLTEDPPLMLNGGVVPVGHRVTPKHEDMLAVAGHRFQFEFDAEEQGKWPATPAKKRIYTCHITTRASDGMEEFRAVDHDLTIGRMALCHVHYAYSTLSRMNALLACDRGDWSVFNLAKGPIAKGKSGAPRVRIDKRALLESGDVVTIGPLLVRFEIPAGAVQDEAPAGLADDPPRKPRRAPPPDDDSQSTEFPSATFDTLAPPDSDAELGGKVSLPSAARKLDHWLKGQAPQPPEKGGWGILKKLADFWTDTPETTRARGLANGGQLREAFEVLEKAIRARPDNPGLLRELYRLYKTAGLGHMCYRPLRHIEKVMKARGKPDPWVLEELARVCASLGPTDPSMFDRAMEYWTKLETATGASRSREKQDTMGQRALFEGGFSSDGQKPPV